MSDFDIRRFEILPLLDDIKLNDKITIQISCIDVCNNDIYLGTTDSFIISYSNVFSKQNDQSSNHKPSYYKYLGLKKPIIQMKVLSIWSRLLFICDSTLFLSNLDNLEVINHFKVRNVYAFCLNEYPVYMDPFNVELCLAKRKSLAISLLNSDKFNVVKEVNVPEQPLLLAMDGHFVCMASANNYYMVNWESGQSQLLCSNSNESYILPICKYISRNEFLINGPSHLGVFVKTSGISEKPPVDWGQNVIKIAYSHPYILCLKSHSISIISAIDQKVKDEFLLENGVHIDNFDGKIVVTTKKSIFSMNKISFEEQIDSLLLNEKSLEAIDLFNNLQQCGLLLSSNNKNEIHYAQLIHIRAGLIELKAKNFDQAKQFLLESHLDLQKLLILNENLVNKLNLVDSRDDQTTSIIDDKQIKALIDNIKNELDLNTINKFLLCYIEELMLIDPSVDLILAKTAQLLIYFEDIQTYSMEIKKFFNVENNYDFKLIECYLENQKHYYHLALFYASKNQMEKCIELLKNLQKKLIHDEYYTGISELSYMLTKCSDARLILNHVEYILEQDQTEGAKILIANTKLDVKQQYTILNPESVISLLHKYRQALVIYLEHLVHSEKVKTTQVHTTLLVIYIEILSLQKENEEQQSIMYETTRDKLITMLQNSDYYDKRIVLKSLTQNGFDYETAMLHGKMGNHQMAFEIYLSKYLDYDQALKHCIQYGMKECQANQSSSTSTSKNIYQTLLSIYLDLYQKNGPEVMKPLLEYLNHSKCRFDMEVTLNELPMEWPVCLLKRHLSKHLRMIFDAKFQTSFGRLMALSMLERAKQEKHRLINQSIRIDRDSICCVCHTKLLDSKFVWMPSNQTVVHDFCYYESTTMMTTSNNNLQLQQNIYHNHHPNDNDINITFDDRFNINK